LTDVILTGTVSSMTIMVINQFSNQRHPAATKVNPSKVYHARHMRPAGVVSALESLSHDMGDSLLENKLRGALLRGAVYFIVHAKNFVGNQCLNALKQSYEVM
jgi:hypothetical protein